MIRKILRSSFSSFIVVFLTTTVFYLTTISTRLTWANFGNDGGDFLTAILTKGVPHPTGYPTYSVLGVMFQLLPLENVYFKGVLLSWFPAAIGAGLFALWVRRFFQDEKKWLFSIIAIISGIIWGLSPFLWSQTTIIEVHGLQSLFLVLSIWWIWLINRWKKEDARSIWLFVLSFCYGLAMGNHITIILVSPAILLSLFFAYRRGCKKRTIVYQILFFILGTLIYLYLPIAASNNPPINWGNPKTVDGFFWMITGGPYQSLLFPNSISLMFSRISALAGLLIEQFGILGVIFAVIGVIQYQHKEKLFPGFLIYLFFIFSIFSIFYATDDSITYLLMPFLVTAIWITFSFKVLHPLRWKNIPIGILVIGVFMVSFFIRIPETIQKISPENQYFPADFAEQTLQQLPKDAILLTHSDPDSFPLWYYHFGLGWRSDVRIIVLPLTQFKWYQDSILRTYPDLNLPPIISHMSNQSQIWGESIPILNPERVVCENTIQREPKNAIITNCSNGQKFEFTFTN